MLFYLHLLSKINNEHWTFSGGRHLFKFRVYKLQLNPKFKCRPYNLMCLESRTKVVVALSQFGKENREHLNFILSLFLQPSNEQIDIFSSCGDVMCFVRFFV